MLFKAASTQNNLIKYYGQNGMVGLNKWKGRICGYIYDVSGVVTPQDTKHEFIQN